MKPTLHLRALPFALTLALASSFSAATPVATSAAIRADGDIQLLTSHVEWTLDGPFALRRVDILLRNPHDKPLETTVQLPLAANERLHGYALDIDGQLRDAVPVERVAARVAFEETVRGRVDPALAQKDAGNSYSIRVFPVPAHGERRLRIEVASLAPRTRCGWQHTLDAGLPAGSSAQAQVIATSTTMPAGLTWKKTQGHFETYLPARGSRSVCLPAPTGDAAYSANFDDGLQMHWLEVPAATAVTTGKPHAQPARIEVLWDASYSMLGIDRSTELQLLSRYLQGRPTDITLRVLRDTVQTRQVHIATPADLDHFITALLAEPADGATNLSAWRADPAAERILAFTDATTSLPGAVMPNTAAPVFVIGHRIADPAMARWLTRSGGQVLDLAQLTPEQALRAMQQIPALQARLGPLDSTWHLEQTAINNGALRGCHITTQASALPTLTLAHSSATGTQLRSHKAATARTSTLAAFWCASWQAEDLEAQPELNRTALSTLGQRFGVANRETSLLVLEHDEDYVRFGILPPAADTALHDRVVQQRQQIETRKAVAWADNREAIRTGWQARTQWWGTVFPKDDPRPRWAEEKARAQARRELELRQQERTRTRAADAAAAYAPMMAVGAPPPAPSADMAVPSASESSGGAAVIGMQLQAVTVDSPYVAELRSAQSAADMYQRYLDLRAQYGQSPAFHFDVAQRLFELGDARLGWRVLSNIVELLPRDQTSLRLVAYRLQEAGLQAQAVDLLRQIKTLAPDEPQSFRDLALALSAQATCKEALDLLQHVVETPWAPRFADIGLIALAEHNDLRTRCPVAIASTLPPEMMQPLPVGLRVVLRWDLNDTDIDLHVTDPNEEEVYYAHRNSYQGGAISRDFTAGYGPEEFILRTPRPGQYKVAVRYYGSRLARLSRGATVNVALQTGFGTQDMHQQSISLRLLEQSGNVAVGSFTVQTGGGLIATPEPAGNARP